MTIDAVYRRLAIVILGLDLPTLSAQLSQHREAPERVPRELPKKEEEVQRVDLVAWLRPVRPSTAHGQPDGEDLLSLNALVGTSEHHF